MEGEEEEPEPAIILLAISFDLRLKKIDQSLHLARRRRRRGSSLARSGMTSPASPQPVSPSLALARLLDNDDEPASPPAASPASPPQSLPASPPPTSPGSLPATLSKKGKKVQDIELLWVG